MTKKTLSSMAGAAFALIPITEVDAGERLYGKPDSLLTTHQLSHANQPLRLELSEQFIEVQDLINDYVIAAFDVNMVATPFEELKLKVERITSKDDYIWDLFNPLLQFIQLFENPQFRQAITEGDHKYIVLELANQGMIGNIDSDLIKIKYKDGMSKNLEFYKDYFDNLGDLNINNNQSIALQSTLDNEILAWPCCISPVYVAVNAAVITNVALAVLVWVAVEVPGGGEDEVKIQSYLGDNTNSIAFCDKNLTARTETALNFANITGNHELKNEAIYSFAMTEISSFVNAAYEIGLIQLEEDKNLLVKMYGHRLRSIINSI